jgi:hypothetical protein
MGAFRRLLAALRAWLQRRPSPPASPPPVTGDRRVIQITHSQPGEIPNRQYPYWSTAWVDGASVVVFVGHVDGHPRFYRVARNGSAVTPLGALVPYAGTGEGWYFDAQGRVTLCDGPRLRRVNPFTGEDTVLFDISDAYPGCDLTQAHSSSDGETHSATVRRIVSDGPYLKIGTIVCRYGQLLPLFEAQGELDESTVDASGRYLLIQESGDNRVIDLDTRDERRIADADGALAHVDVGAGFAVGEADKPEPGQCAYLDLASLAWRPLFYTRGMGHVSVRGQTWLLSDDTALSLIDPATGDRRHLLDHGMVVPPNPTPDEKYNHQVFAPLDPTGLGVVLISNRGTDRFDAFWVDL